MTDPARRQRILRQRLRTEALMGIEAVPLAAPPQRAEAVEPVEPAPAPTSARDARPERAGERRSGSPATPEPASRQEKIDRLETINQQEAQTCQACGLCAGRSSVVFGEGDPDASLMFIGEGPGQREDELGRPFVGRAGELLTKMIKAMGFERDQVYITNIVKCRPPNNRAPTPEEVATCWPFLKRQIEIIRPRVIVTLGGPATKTILETRDGITRLRGRWHTFPGVDPPIPVMPTFHPAFLLRQYTQENRGRVWADLQQVMELLGEKK